VIEQNKGLEEVQNPVEMNPQEVQESLQHQNSSQNHEDVLILEDMKNLPHLTDEFPDVIFLIDPKENQNVLREANLLKIPVIALADSHAKISGIDYMIPGNIQSIEFVYWCLNMITILLQKRNQQKKQS